MAQSNPGSDPNKRTIMVDGQQVDLDTFVQMQSGFNGPIPMPKRRRGGCGIGLIVLLLVIVVPLILILVFAGNLLSSFDLGNLGNVINQVIAIETPESRTLTGDASRFDPFAALAEAQEFAGEGAQLATIRAAYVRADGTMDLNATYSPAPRTEYTFLREIPRPADAPPVGVAGSTAGPWYEPITIEAYQPGQRRQVTETSGGVRKTYFYVNQGMTKEIEDPTTTPFDEIAPQPTCAFTDLWKTAIREGAPEDAVAVIEYDSEAYIFNITGTIFLRFDHDCNLVQ